MSIRGGDRYKRMLNRLALETDLGMTELLRVLIDLGIGAYAAREGHESVDAWMKHMHIPWPVEERIPPAKTKRAAAKDRVEKRMGGMTAEERSAYMRDVALYRGRVAEGELAVDEEDDDRTPWEIDNE